MLLPYASPVGVFSAIAQRADAQTPISQEINSQNISLGYVALGPDAIGGRVALVDQAEDPTTLTPLMGPSGSVADITDTGHVAGDITFYTVRKGDTLSSIAELFGVTKETITTANNISGSRLSVGDTLVILPVSGHRHTVRKGDTLYSIARKYKVASKDILFFNDMRSDDVLSIGAKLLIPNPEFDGVPQQAPVQTTTPSRSYATRAPASKVNLGNFILRPIEKSLSVRTQGAHGYAGGSVDLGAKIGTPVVASHDGLVVLAKSSGYNYGYGKYIILMTEYNGKKIQTIYAHLSSVHVTPGQTVSRGELIGRVGSTGNSTGPHLHFEVRGALNPLTIDRNYTGQ